MLPSSSWTTDPNAFRLIGHVDELAKCSGIVLEEAPTPEQIDMLFGEWGTEKVFGKNVPKVMQTWRLGDDGLPIREIQTTLELAMNTHGGQGVRTVDAQSFIRCNPVVDVIITGGVANWMERRVNELRKQIEGRHGRYGLRTRSVYMLVSNRVCDTATETGNRYVQAYHKMHKRYPTERELLQYLLWTRCRIRIKPANVFVAASLEEQVRIFAKKMKRRSGWKYYVPTNLNAEFVPLLVRRVLCEVWGQEFDSRRGRRFWFSYSKFPIARTPEELADSANYQNPFTIPSGLARLIKELYLLHQEA